MLEIKNTEVFGLDRAILASGNAMTTGEINTSDKSDWVRPENLVRGYKLGKAPVGSGHDHFLLGIHVQFDIKYPQYWTIEAERYHNFEIITSQSKMHRLTSMGKDWNEFYAMFNEYTELDSIKIAYSLIQKYNDTDEKQYPELKYTLFMRAVSSLPMGFEMWMTCDLTYLQLKTIYHQRKNHKLKEDWGPFCKWCEELPRFKELIGIP